MTKRKTPSVMNSVPFWPFPLNKKPPIMLAPPKLIKVTKPELKKVTKPKTGNGALSLVGAATPLLLSIRDNIDILLKFANHIPAYPHLYIVRKPLQVFKKTYIPLRDGTQQHVVTNLVIPVGAIIAYGGRSSGKMRADIAVAHSNVKIHKKNGEFTPAVTASTGSYTREAYSGYHRSFKYTPASRDVLTQVLAGDLTAVELRLIHGDSSGVYTIKNFDISHQECASGVHFYLDAYSALRH